jgi:predicted naringenin-chalcone synthase
MSADIFLHSLQSVLPLHHMPQNVINDWTVSAHLKTQSFCPVSSEEERFVPLMRKFCVGEGLISQRYYECGEVDQNWDEHEIYKITKETPQGADIGLRNLFFEKASRRVFSEFYDKGNLPEHLIHVSCTGYVAPSPAQVYFSERDKVPAITHAYHMGCYASLPSVRLARALAVDKCVDVVHTEMCSLHLDLSHHTPEQMVVQTLFGDGHIKYTLSPTHTESAFKVLHVEESLVRNSLQDMTWIPGGYGMQMTLSREVPTKIQAGIHEFIARMKDQFPFEQEKTIFAIHPGGPKIIDAIQKSLNLTEEQIGSSKKILFERGNMSSATLPHVWQHILSNKENKGKKVVSLAFGPGLTMFGGLFEVV